MSCLKLSLPAEKMLYTKICVDAGPIQGTFGESDYALVQVDTAARARIARNRQARVSNLADEPLLHAEILAALDARIAAHRSAALP